MKNKAAWLVVFVLLGALVAPVAFAAGTRVTRSEFLHLRHRVTALEKHVSGVRHRVHYLEDQTAYMQNRINDLQTQTSYLGSDGQYYGRIMRGQVWSLRNGCPDANMGATVYASWESIDPDQPLRLSCSN